MQKRLFDDFPPVSAKEWKQKIQYELKGGDYNEKMVWESPEGIKVKPFYTLEDRPAKSQGPVPPPQEWKIAQMLSPSDPDEGKARIRQSITMGAESLIIGLADTHLDFKKLLDGTDFGKTVLHFCPHFLSPAYVNDLRKYLSEKRALFHIHVDPIGHLVGTGNWFFGQKDDLVQFKACIDLTHTLCIDASRYQNAGGHMVQQLAYTLAHANEYLNTVEENSVQKTIFKMAVGGNYFFEIAKLRALRKLWVLLARAYGVPEQCHIIASPTLRNKTLYAYNNNILRTTTECMSAVLGGADTIGSLPYDTIYQDRNDFSERIALNQLLLLKNEGHFDPSKNPASGAYYIESLTAQLGQQALRLFKQIEASGGFLKQLKAGTIQKKIRESAQKEQQGFDKGEEVLVGTNAYQNPMDRMKGHLKTKPLAKRRRQQSRIEPLIAKRLAEKSEYERLKNEARP